MGIFDIFLLEALINGILLGGVLALLSLGLNLVFGVIDVVWICYAELIMIGMYGMYYLVQYYGLSYYLAAPLAILLVFLVLAAPGGDAAQSAIELLGEVAWGALIGFLLAYSAGLALRRLPGGAASGTGRG